MIYLGLTDRGGGGALGYLLVVNNLKRHGLVVPGNRGVKMALGALGGDI